MATADANKDLFSSVISDIKSYSGEDPIVPWLRGMKRMKESLEPRLLKEKLPRFLQRCTQKFVAERRYTNDLRFLHVWIHLMDYVDDPGVVLEKMERNKIGMKWSLFYQAYALYYEKNKKFAEAEKMYHLGVQNLAEPMDELKKSYELFLRRMDRHKTKRILRQSRKSSKICNSDDSLKSNSSGKLIECGDQKDTLKVLEENPCNGERVDVIVQKSQADNRTISTKEAVRATKSTFTDPLEMVAVSTGSARGCLNENKSCGNKFEVFVDQQLDPNHEECKSVAQSNKIASSLRQEEGFHIYIDGEESPGQSSNSEPDQSHKSHESLTSSSSNASAFVFPIPKDLLSENSSELGGASSCRGKFREDTVVRKFVGSTVMDDEPAAENVCHHGLIEPTINLKQAMDEINNMFGKPMEFVRKRRSKKKDEEQVNKRDAGAFVILPDDEPEDTPVQASSSEKAPDVQDARFSILPDHDEDHKVLALPRDAGRTRECDLYEPTVFTKEAMDDINKMFGMPLDF